MTKKERSGVELLVFNRDFPAWGVEETVTVTFAVPRRFTRSKRTLVVYARALGRLLSELRSVRTKTGRTWRLP